jgi:hypothetical protein
MVFDVWLVFRRRTDSKIDRHEAMHFVKATSNHVFLMGVEFEHRATHRVDLCSFRESRGSPPVGLFAQPPKYHNAEGASHEKI